MTEGSGTVRLQKYLSGAGVASRRESETIIAEGRVRVNGLVVTEPGVRVVPGKDVIEVDRKKVETQERRWIMYHKPPALLTTRTDPLGRPTIYDRLPREVQGLTYVGRLDWGTEGLLLLTNDGDLAHLLLHPSRGVEREYRVWVDGTPTALAQRKIHVGVELEDGLARAERIKLLREEPEKQRSLLKIVLKEGRKREVRRLMEAVGHKVLYLKRVRFGPLEIGTLQRGHFRELDEKEVRELERAVRDGGRERNPRGAGVRRRDGTLPRDPRDVDPRGSKMERRPPRPASGAPREGPGGGPSGGGGGEARRVRSAPAAQGGKPRTGERPRRPNRPAAVDGTGGGIPTDGQRSAPVERGRKTGGRGSPQTATEGGRVPRDRERPEARGGSRHPEARGGGGRPPAERPGERGGKRPGGKGGGRPPGEAPERSGNTGERRRGSPPTGPGAGPRGGDSPNRGGQGGRGKGGGNRGGSRPRTRGG